MLLPSFILIIPAVCVHAFGGPSQNFNPALGLGQYPNGPVSMTQCSSLLVNYVSTKDDMMIRSVFSGSMHDASQVVTNGQVVPEWSMRSGARIPTMNPHVTPMSVFRISSGRELCMALTQAPVSIRQPSINLARTCSARVNGGHGEYSSSFCG
jgi:hypothetical protein